MYATLSLTPCSLGGCSRSLELRSCVVEGDCVASSNYPTTYPDNDRCVIEASSAVNQWQTFL